MQGHRGGWWQCCISSVPVLSSFEVPGALGGSRHAYLGLDSQYDLGQGHDEALESDGDVLQHKVGDPHDPQQVKEVQGLQVGLQEYEAGECSKNQVTHLDLVLGSFLSLRNLAMSPTENTPTLASHFCGLLLHLLLTCCVTSERTLNLSEPSSLGD